MGSGNEFDIVLKLIDQLTPAMAQVQGQLKTAMANMAGSTKPVSDAMDRLSKSLSGDKLIQDAKNIVAAVQQIGGATKLTEAETAKYNATLTQAMAKLKALGQEAPADMQALASATKQAGGVLNDLSSHVAATAAGFLTAQAIINGASTIWHTFTGVIEESITAWSVQESATSKMTAALRQHGLATPAVIAQYVALSSQLQRTTTYADELTQGAAALLTEIGDVMPSKMAGALKASTDLAAGLGIDLDSATRLVAKAAAGHTETLGRYGIVVSDVALKTQGFDAVLDAINRQFGGQAAAAMDTYAGRVAVLKNAWGDVLEELGKAIVMNPQVESGIRGVTKALQEWVDQRDRVTHLREDFDGTAQSFDTLALKIGEGTRSFDSYEQAGQQAMVVVKELNAELEKSAERALRMPDPWANLKDQQIKSPAPPFTGSVAGFQGAIADQLQIPDATRLQLFRQSLQTQLSQLTASQQQAATAAFAQGQSVEQATHSLEAYWPEIEKSKGALDALKKVYDQSKEAAAKYNEAVARYNSTDGPSYASILDKIGNETYEGIAFDKARGKSTEDMVQVWKQSSTVIEQVIKSEKAFDDEQAQLAKTMSENEQETAKFQQGLGKLLVGYDAVGKIVVGFTGILHTIDPALIQNSESLVQMQQRLKETEEAFKKTFGAFADISLRLPAGLTPSGNVQSAFEPLRTATKDAGSFSQELGSIVHELNSVGSSSDSAFGRVLHDVGLALNAVQALDKAMKLSGLGSIDPGASPAGGANVGGSAGGLAVAGGGAAMAAATASALTIVGAWVAVGVAVYSFVSALREANKEAEKLYKISVATKEALTEFKVSTPFSDALGQGLADTKENFAHITALNTVFKTHNELLAEAQRLGIDVYGPRMGRNAAMLSDAEIAAKVNLQSNDAYLSELSQAAHLTEIVKELGGVSALTADQLEMVHTRAGQLFDLYKLGGPVAAAAAKTMDDTLIEFTKNLDHGRVDDFFTDMVAQARAAGMALPQVADFFTGQVANMVAGLNDLLTQPLITSSAVIGKAVTDAQAALDTLKESGTATADALKKAQDQLTAALTDQHAAAEGGKQALDDLGLMAFTTFNAAIASGQDFVTALHGIAPQVDIIKKAYDDLGLSIDDAAVRGLTMENTILNGPNGVGKAISGLQAVVTGGMNFGKGVETPEAFAAQQRTLASVYMQTQSATAAAGGTTINALLPFQQTLHTMEDWAKKNGQELDAHTQQMIDQSRDLGIWNDDFKSDSEKTRESIADLIASNEALARALGAAGPWAQGGTPSSGFLPGDDPTGGLRHPPIPIPMADGGFGFAKGPMWFSTKGNEEYAFSGEGKRFSRGDDQGQPQTQTIVYSPTYNFSAFKPDNLAEIVEHEVAPQLLGLFEDRVRDYQERLAAVAAQRRRT